MGLVRYLNPQKYYDSEKKRFQSLAFCPSENGGISVVDIECAQGASGSLCEHGIKYYRTIGEKPGPAGDPVIFWEIPDDLLPRDCEVRQSDSDTGDPCHHEIEKWNEKEARKTFKQIQLSEMKICAEDGIRPLTIEDLEGRYE